MPTKWWESEPEEEERKRRARKFAQWAEETRSPKVRLPWDPHPEAPEDPRTPPTGPEAAERFRQQSDGELDTWRQTMLAIVQPPAMAETQPPEIAPSRPSGARTVEAAPEYAAADSPREIPAWLRERGPAAEAEWRQAPEWKRVLTQGVRTAYETQAAPTEELARDLQARVRGEPTTLPPERRAELATESALTFGGLAEGPKLGRAGKAAGKARKAAGEAEAPPPAALAEPTRPEGVTGLVAEPTAPPAAGVASDLTPDQAEALARALNADRRAIRDINRRMVPPTDAPNYAQAAAEMAQKRTAALLEAADLTPSLTVKQARDILDQLWKGIGPDEDDAALRLANASNALGYTGVPKAPLSPGGPSMPTRPEPRPEELAPEVPPPATEPLGRRPEATSSLPLPPTSVPRVASIQTNPIELARNTGMPTDFYEFVGAVTPTRTGTDVVPGSKVRIAQKYRTPALDALELRYEQAQRSQDQEGARRLAKQLDAETKRIAIDARQQLSTLPTAETALGVPAPPATEATRVPAPTGRQKALLESVESLARMANDDELADLRTFWQGRNEPEAVALVEREIAARPTAVRTPETGPTTAPDAPGGPAGGLGARFDPASRTGQEAPVEAAPSTLPVTEAAPTVPEPIRQDFLREIAGARDLDELLEIPDRIKAAGVSDAEYTAHYADAYRTRRLAIQVELDAQAQAEEAAKAATRRPRKPRATTAGTPPTTTTGQPVTPGTPGQGAPPGTPGAPPGTPPGTPSGTPGGPAPSRMPAPALRGRLLPRMRATAEIDQQITHEGQVKSLAESLARLPGGKGLVEKVDPGLVALEPYERVPLVMGRLEDQAANIRRDAMLQLDALWSKVKGLRIEKGRIVEGARPILPGQSMAWVDVFEHIDDYHVSPELQAYVKLANRLIDEATGDARAAGAKLHLRDFGTGHYYGRVVEAVREAEKRGAHRPDMPRVYDSMEAGIQRGIDYADDPMATFEVVLGAVQRREIGAHMRQVLEPLSRKPSELLDPSLTQEVGRTTVNLRQLREFGRVVRGVRDGMSPYYQADMPGAPAGTKLREQLAVMEPGHPGLVQQVLDGAQKTGDERTRWFQGVMQQSDKLVANATKEYGRAKSARARAMEHLQSPEFAEGERFGLPKGTIGVGRVQTSWAGSRLFPRDTADYLNKAFNRDHDNLVTVANQMAGATRTMQAGFDLGTMALQLLPVLGADPKAWVKAWAGMFRYVANPKGYAEYMSQPWTRGLLKELVPRGLTIEGIEYTQAMERGGALDLAAAGAGKLAEAATRSERVGQAVSGGLQQGVLRRLDMAFEAPLNIAKMEMARSLYPLFHREGQLDDLATFLNDVTGTRSSLASGIGRNQHSIESGLLFFSPRYTRSALALIGDAMQGGLKGTAARNALGGMLVAGMAFPAALRVALGQPIDDKLFDPRESEFMTAEVFGRRVGFGTFYRSLLALGGSVARTAEENPEAFLNPRDRRQHPLTRWFNGRTSPFTSLIFDVVEQRDFQGEPLKAPGDYARRAARLLTPMAAQEYVGTPPGEEAPEPAGVLPDVFGLRAVPLSPAAQRDKLRGRYAQAEYGRPWYAPAGKPEEGLSLSQRHKLEEKHPDLVEAADKAQATGERRGYVDDQFWREVDRQRQPLEQQIVELGKQLRRGEISGNDYRARVGEREADMARIPDSLKAQEQYREVPLTEAERKEKYGKDYQPSTHPVDMFQRAYYGLADVFRDPGTGVVDPTKLSRAREALKASAPPAVVKDAMEDITRHRDAEYVAAQEVWREYMAIPRWVGVTPEKADQLARAEQQLRAISASLPPIEGKTQMALARLAQTQGAEMARQAREATMRPRNPARARFRLQHPELERFYSDLLKAEQTVPEAAQTVAP